MKNEINFNLTEKNPQFDSRGPQATLSKHYFNTLKPPKICVPH